MPTKRRRPQYNQVVNEEKSYELCNVNKVRPRNMNVVKINAFRITLSFKTDSDYSKHDGLDRSEKTQKEQVGWMFVALPK